jgi:ectoine hydroxylase-related dioxygenase (phytanoyl-CoA dioxygenase family)
MLGRVTHGRFGTQTGIDPERIKLLEPLFERVYCEMSPGAVLFFHCNLLHASGPNLSEHPRRSVIMCYNALGNPQLKVDHNENLGLKVTSEQRPVPVGREDGILAAATGR